MQRLNDCKPFKDFTEQATANAAQQSGKTGVLNKHINLGQYQMGKADCSPACSCKKGTEISIHYDAQQGAHTFHVCYEKHRLLSCPSENALIEYNTFNRWGSTTKKSFTKQRSSFNNLPFTFIPFQSVFTVQVE